MVQLAGELHVNAGAVVADKAGFSFLTHLISRRSAAFGLYIGSGPAEVSCIHLSTDVVLAALHSKVGEQLKFDAFRK